MTKPELPPGHKRYTFVFNAKHVKAIEREIKRRSKERGYKVPVVEAFRELIDEKWGAQ